MVEPIHRPVLQAQGVARVFPGPPPVQALGTTDLAVERGELLAVAGPSGSGKTTLLQILAGIDTPSAGAVRLDGEVLSALSPRERAARRLRGVGLVFAEDNLSPALTLAENVELPLALLGLGPAERRRRVAAQLQALGIGALGRRLPDRVSGGERQRAALARALVTRPKVLVADEPSAHLDGENTATLLDLLRAALAEQGLAAVLASHDERVLTRADRVLRLVDGVPQTRGGAAAGGPREPAA